MAEADELIARSRLPVSADRAFAWHERAGAFERLTPPWERMRVRERRGTIHDGDYVVLELRVGPISRRWVSVHSDYREGRSFVDEQVIGPFAFFRHQHLFEPAGDGCRMEDRIEYRLPFGLLGRAVGGAFARKRLARIFGYRHAVVAADLRRHEEARPLKVAVSGASGLIGRQLCAFLSTGGAEVRRLSRRWPAESPDDIFWDPARGAIAAERLEGLDAVVHLAGENLAEGRWTRERKQRIRDSRIDGTRLIAETLARLERPPAVLVSASAVGIYGARGELLVDEDDAPGAGFLAEVCRAWEAAAEPARRAGIRVVHPRFGVVLSPAGGALARMLTPFSLGLGGPIGGGRQGMSWVALDDALYACARAITDERLRGPVNVVAPQPVTQREFAATLGAVLGRPAVLPLPAPVVRLLFGELGERALLEGALVKPRRLEEVGFRFELPTLASALRHLLGRSGARRFTLAGRTAELLP